MKAQLESMIRKTLSSMGIQYTGDIVFTRTKDKKFGDVSTNIAMVLAKIERKNPKAVAQDIVDRLTLDSSLIEKAEIAGSGFINFFFGKNYLFSEIKVILEQGERYGSHTAGNGKRVNVEFVSANPTGPLSIGHGRQAVLGDVISRIMENGGYNVTREYYFNNAGMQMKRLGESVRLRYLELLGETITFPEKHYEGLYIIDIAKQILDEHGDSWRDKDYLPFKKVAEDILFANIRQVLKRIDLEFDVYFNEDSLYQNGKIESLVQTFKDRQLAYEKENALWIKTSEFKYDQGQKAENDKVIIKATGEPTYRLPDMAYHINKFERNFDLMIDIFGADHIAEYPDVLAALKALGYPTERVHVIVHQFVTLSKEGEILKMSKRKANFITIDELVDLLGSDVFRYFLIMRSHHSHLNFDLELAQKETMENPVYYVQNAHARICSIEAKAAERGVLIDQNSDVNLSLLIDEIERDIVQKLTEYPELTRRLLDTFEAHPITTYLEELAALYHRYQTAGKKDDRLRVVTNDSELTKARLVLCRVTKTVLANGLKLLGISQPVRMSREIESETAD
ncbi:arginine--tRNA ligase [bacterium]|nr:arginine--tRNA ligase [bacterium]